MVAICRALAADARLVFMDEPTASLTQAETDALLGVIRRLTADGIAVVLVSHRLAEVLEVCERVTVLRDGRLVGVFPTAGMTQTRLTELMTGQTFETSVRRRDLAAAPTVLEVRGLTRRGEYARRLVQPQARRDLGLTGLLGAGRTELALSLFGMTRPDGGEIRLEGRPVRFGSNRDAIAAGIAYVSEDRLTLGLVQPQSIADNTVITVLDRLVSALRLFRPGSARPSLSAIGSSALDVKIGGPGNAVSTLSGGNQQRIVLAKWLATAPKVLILDSPTVGVDVGAREGIFRIVRGLADTGMSILLISDEIPEVYFNADRVLHMRGGRIIAEFMPAEIGDGRDRGRDPCLGCPLLPRPRRAGWSSSSRPVSTSRLATDSFLTVGNLFDLLNINAINMIFAVGLLVVLVTGGIDISFAVAASVAQYLTVTSLSRPWAAATGPPASSWPRC